MRGLTPEIIFYVICLTLFQSLLGHIHASEVAGGEVHKASAVALTKDQFSQLVQELQSGEGRLDDIKMAKDLRALGRDYEALRAELVQEIAQLLANKIIKLVDSNQHNPNMQCMILTYSAKIDHPSLEEYYQKNKNHAHGGVRRCIKDNIAYMQSDEVRKLKPFQAMKLPADYAPVLSTEKANTPPQSTSKDTNREDAKK